MKRISFVVSILLWHKNKLLLLHRAKHFERLGTGRGLWDLPGGKMTLRGTMRDSARRKLREETGIEYTGALKFRKVLFYTVKGPTGSRYRINVLLAAKLKKKPDIKLSDEHDDFMFVAKRKDLSELKMLKEVRAWLRERYG